MNTQELKLKCAELVALANSGSKNHVDIACHTRRLYEFVTLSADDDVSAEALLMDISKDPSGLRLECARLIAEHGGSHGNTLVANEVAALYDYLSGKYDK